MEVVLEDNGLKEFIDQYNPKPPTLDAKYLAEWKKCMVKLRWMTLREFETTLSQVSMGRKLHMLYQNH